MSSSSSIGKLFMFIIDFKAAFRFYAFIMLEFSFSDFKSGAFFFSFSAFSFHFVLRYIQQSTKIYYLFCS
ncbi:hypothetical protein OIU77_023656 [Salix suchowensis]|uniref:Uncharacterized protein n=1 Tax=Salix suchowensis TaxID=1278906 RepID=A0ABQ9C4M9_9ROSI|nr:hypothetical protein OIU77_023656 [Salix suchowensis]